MHFSSRSLDQESPFLWIQSLYNRKLVLRKVVCPNLVQTKGGADNFAMQKFQTELSGLVYLLLVFCQEETLF